MISAPSVSLLQKIKAFLILISPLAVLVVALVFVTLITNKYRESADQIHQQTYDDESKLIMSLIKNRFDLYANALHAGVGFLNGSESVNRQEWKDFVDSINLQSNFPGIQGYGYSVVLNSEEKEQYIQSIRDEGFPNFIIYPAGVRQQYTSITFLEPFDKRNQQAFGYDMFSERVRQEAMIKSRDEGHLQLSGKVTLVQEIDEDKQPGFLLYLPWYGTNFPPDTKEERKSLLKGYVYAPFRARNFMEALFPTQSFTLDFVVFDGDVPQPSVEAFLYDSVKGRTVTEMMEQKNEFIKRNTLSYANHTWTIFFARSNQNHVGRRSQQTANTVLVSGIVISFLITCLLYLLMHGKNRAQKLANAMTLQLQERTKELEDQRKIVESTNEALEEKSKMLERKVNEIEEINEHMLNREEKMIELKEKMQQLQKTRKMNTD